MTRSELIKEIRKKNSFLCVGLDPDPDKIPAHLMDKGEDPVFEFNRRIIDATAPYCVSFKPNTAFYEAYGIKGLQTLENTILYIRNNYPDHFIIADAKRGDIGNTSSMYAKAFFDFFRAHAVTVAPYMGSDSVKPFLAYEGKWAIVLGLTSNEGAADFQMKDSGGTALFQRVIETCRHWGSAENMMFVIGATKAAMLAEVRKIVPEHFLLIPGVGAQGGSLKEVCCFGLNKEVGLLVNASRSILYASGGEDFDVNAAEEAKKMALEMKEILGKM